MTDFLILLPEILLMLTVLGLFVCEISYSGERLRLVSWIGMIGLFATFVEMLVSYKELPVTLFNGSFIVDGVSVFFKFLFIAIGILGFALCNFSKEVDRLKNSEVFTYIVLAILGAFVLVSSQDLLLTGVALSVLLMSAVVLSLYSRRDLASTHSGVKLALSGLYSLLLYFLGVLVIQRVTGSFLLIKISELWNRDPSVGSSIWVAGILWLFSFSFYFGVFPGNLFFREWMEGVPVPSAAFFTQLFRVVGFAAAFRLAPALIPSAEHSLIHYPATNQWVVLLNAAAAITMLMGAVLAYRQTTLRKMLSYLFLSQSGFLLLTFITLQTTAYSSFLYLLWVETFAGFGIFLFLSNLVDELGHDGFDALVQVRNRGAWLEIVFFLIFLLSFLGFPPFSGFIGKFSIIGKVIEGHQYPIAAIALLTSAIQMLSFCRIAFSLVGQPELGGAHFLTQSSQKRIFFFVLLAPLFLLNFATDLIRQWAEISLNFIVW